VVSEYARSNKAVYFERLAFNNFFAISPGNLVISPGNTALRRYQSLIRADDDAADFYIIRNGIVLFGIVRIVLQRIRNVFRHDTA
jgi:hypothetical protein